MKRVLVVGAGIGQLYIAKKLKERGDYLITVTLPDNQPVIGIADKVIYENVFDKESVLRKAIEARVEAVVSDQNDTMMPTVSYLAEHLGLPGNSIAVTNAYCNKNIFRKNCDILGIPVPIHAAVSSSSIPEEMKDIPFPWVVKPADSQSSLGVTKVSSSDAYVSAVSKALSFSKTHSAIVEEFFSGQELVAEGFIYKGQYYNLGFADRKYFDLQDIFIPSQTIFPSLLPASVLSQITECECKMAKYVNPDFAIVHSEYLYNPSIGQFKVVESALRGGGVYISSHLIPLYCGIDINDILLDCATGKQINIEEIMSHRCDKASGYICFYLPEGRVISIKGVDSIMSHPSVRMADFHGIEIGTQAPPICHKGQRLGPILLSSENRDELDRSIAEIQQTLSIQVLSHNGEIKGVMWC